MYYVFTNQIVIDTNEMDASKVIHSIITKQPTMIHQLDSLIPIGISRIVSKLLEKDPTNRYQTAQSLCFDLTLCLRLIQSNDVCEIDSNLLCCFDRFRTHKQSNKLYGFDKHRQTIDLLISNVINQFQRQIILISGEAGIGSFVRFCFILSIFL